MRSEWFITIEIKQWIPPSKKPLNRIFRSFIPGVGDVCPASSKEIVYVKRRCPGTTIISKIRAVRAWMLLPQNTAKGFKQILLSENFAYHMLRIYQMGKSKKYYPLVVKLLTAFRRVRTLTSCLLGQRLGFPRPHSSQAGRPQSL